MSKKITQLPASGALAAEDLFEKVDDPAGAPVSQKASLANLLSFIDGQNPLSIGGGKALFYPDGSITLAGDTLDVSAAGGLLLKPSFSSLAADGSVAFAVAGGSAFTVAADGTVSFASGAFGFNPDGSAVMNSIGIDVLGAITFSALANSQSGATIGFGGALATIARVLTATATLDFPNTIAQTNSDLTIAVSGAAVGDCVQLGVPNGSVMANSTYSAWVSAADTITVRFNNAGVLAQDPASGTFRVAVTQFS